MKRSNSTSWFLRGWTLMSMMLCMLAWGQTAQAQHCTIACNDNIQVSLGTDCRAVITYDLVLEDADNSRICSPNGPQAFVITVLDHLDRVVAQTGTDKDYITCEDVANNDGNVFRVSAKHWATGNNCWGTITVEDKIKPEIYCQDVNLWCNQPFTPEYIECNIGAGFGYPRTQDNCDELSAPVYYPNLNDVDCGDITLSYEDNIIDDDCVNNLSAIIERTWTAVDASGNEASCVQYIYLFRVNVYSLNLDFALPNYTGLPGDRPAIQRTKANNCAPNTDPGLLLGGNCPDGEGNLVGETTRPGNGGTTGEPTGFPMIHGIPVTKAGANGFQYPWDSYGFCEINVEYKDHVVDVCPGSYKILRTWKLIDWCTNDIREHTQIIKVVDEEAVIACPGDQTTTTDINSKDCVATYDLPDGLIWEACGVVNSAYVSIIGTRQVQRPYASWAEEEYYVLERRPGTIVGAASGDPVVVDFGSMKLPGPDCTKDAEVYQVIYEYIDKCGNEASCTYTVTVTDGTKPTPVCETVTTITVGQDCQASVDAALFDRGSFDNCDDELTFYARRKDNPGSEFAKHVSFNEEDVWKSAEGTSCLVELLVVDCHGNENTCWVEVFVDDKQKPVVTVEDATICCGDLENNGVIPADLVPDPVVTDNCPGYTIEVEVSDWRNDCYIGTVTYTYTATDRHGNVSEPVDQVITVVDCTPLTVEFPEDVTFECTTAGGTGFGDPIDPDVTGRPVASGDDCELVAVSYEDEVFRVSDDACFKVVRTWTVIDWCQYDPLHPSDAAFFSASQIIKVIDNTPPVLEAPADEEVCIDEKNACATAVVVGAPSYDDCSSEVRIRAEWSYVADADYCGVSRTGVVADASQGFISPVLEPGTLTVTFIADDGCNNVTKDDAVYLIEDCKNPTPYARDGIRVEIHPAGEITVWASDLDLGSFDNCDGCAANGVRVSFSPDPDDTQRTFTCDDIGTNYVELWVTDQGFNQDYVETFVIVQDNLGVCKKDGATADGMATVAGRVANVNGELIEQVTVSVNGNAAATQAVTGAAGNYNFDLSVGGDYTITPEKDLNPLNGVSTYDLVLLRKHVLGTELLDNPYNLIAADINKSGSITTFDMVELRKVILQVEPTFADNESWRFVDAGYEFTTENALAENYNEVYNINNLDNDMNIDFVAVKVGDLNGTAIPNSLVGTAEARTAGKLTLNATDRLVEAGQTVTVEFTADMANKAGYQFTLDFNGLQMVDLVEGTAKAENFNTNLANRGLLATSWDGTAADEALFAVTFKATTTGQLSELISVNSDLVAAEAYTNAGDVLDVALNFNASEAVSASFELYQNTPNPFTGETVIGFNLPEAGTATLRVLDVQGKVLLQQKGDFVKGANQISINSKSLSATGVLYYQLESADNVATKKMIVIE